MKMKNIFLSLLFVFLSFSQQIFAAEWYEGGTLHQATALQWQKASDADKLATCGDIVSIMYKNKSFNPDLQKSIKTMDDLKLLASQLRDGLNQAFKPFDSPNKNQEKYKNQSVADASAMLAIVAGWTK